MSKSMGIEFPFTSGQRALTSNDVINPSTLTPPVPNQAPSTTKPQSSDPLLSVIKNPLSGSSEFSKAVDQIGLEVLQGAVQNNNSLLIRIIHSLVVSGNDAKITALSSSIRQTNTETAAYIDATAMQIKNLRALARDFDKTWTSRAVPMPGQPTFKLTSMPIEPGEVATVPQNTAAIAVLGEAGKSKLVTQGVQDCLALMLYSPEKKIGVLVHFPIGSDQDLSGVVAELKKMGVNLRNLKAYFAGGKNETTLFNKRTGKLVPSASVMAEKLRVQMMAVGIDKKNISSSPLSSKEEREAGHTALGLDLKTGQPFFVEWKNFSKIPPAPSFPEDSAYSNLQDRTTEVYHVTAVEQATSQGSNGSL